MVDYRNYGYKENSGFFGAPQQVCASINHFRKTNELAISANTCAIYDQTDRLEAMISAQTIMQHNDSVAMKNQQMADAQAARINFTTLFGKLIDTLKGVFTKDRNAEVSGTSKTFYEMVKEENDDTQAYLSAHTVKTEAVLNQQTNVMKNESDETQGILSAHTKTMSGSSRVLTNAIENQTYRISEDINILNHSGNTTVNNQTAVLASVLDGIREAILRNTSGDTVNAQVLKNAIDDIEIRVNNNNYYPQS